MDKRQILILLKIGSMDVSNKCIKSVSVDRNFSDVGDKFTIDIVDTPDTQIAYDLELYMSSGYRSIMLKYGDISQDELVSYTGTIWDYTNTFVGNIKTLTITGIMNRYTRSDAGAGDYTYNIDWNSYFNKRRDLMKPYGAITALRLNALLLKRYTITTKDVYYRYNRDQDLLGKDESVTSFTSSAILAGEYKEAINENALTLSIKGPSGNTIELPIPDSFIKLDNAKIPPNIKSWFSDADATNYPEFYSVMFDPEDKYWGELHIEGNSSSSSAITASNIYDYPNFYIAAEFYIDYPSNSDNLTEGRRIKKVTKDILQDTVALALDWTTIFTSGYDDASGKWVNSDYAFQCASNHFIAQEWLYLLGLADEDDDGTTPGDKNNKKYWYNGGGNEYANLYGSDIKQKTAILDEDNTITYYVNNKNKVVAFRQARASYGSSLFVCVSNEDWTKMTTQTTSDRDWNLKKWDFTQKAFKFYGPPTAYSAAIAREQNEYTFYDDGKYNEEALAAGYRFSNLRAFTLNINGSVDLYVQANPDAKNSVYGTAAILNSGIGVDISDIVKKLAKLEGWDYDDKDIVQTELVPNSDTFVMQGQTAMDFIVNNLVPKAITPLGLYYVWDNAANAYVQQIVDTPQGGFYPFFDKNGKFHFQPLTEKTITKIDIPNLGYNRPNSPMLSFQINTKGTAFYVNRNIDYSPMSIVSGEKVSYVEVASDALVEQIASTRGHNDTFDAWLGLTYNDVEKYAGANASATAKYNKALELAQNALVTKPSALLMGTAAANTADVRAKLDAAKSKIEKTVIKATLSMWGDTRVAPARTIEVTNMVKGGVSNSQTPQKHPSSGKYLILSMQDRIDSGGFIQNLNLLRYTQDVTSGINTYKIDYSRSAEYTREGGTHEVKHTLWVADDNL